MAYLPDGGDLTHCVQKIVRRFVTQLSPGDTSCIPKVRAIRTVPHFARLAEELAPVEALNGNRASASERRLASAALETVGDVIARFLITFGIGSGLRGGEFTYTINPSGYDFVLDHVKWTDDVQVSGTISWNQFTDAISADVKLSQNGRRVGRLDIDWNDGQRNAVAQLSGTVGDSRLEARRIAP